MSLEITEHYVGVIARISGKYLVVRFKSNWGEELLYHVPFENVNQMDCCFIGSCGILFGLDQLIENWGFIPHF